MPGTFEDVGGPGEVAFGWWEVANVFADPCHWKDSLADPPVGPTVDDLATAFLGAGRTRRVRIRRDVVLGGLPAKRIELSVPADLDVATCDEGVYREFLALANRSPSLGTWTPRDRTSRAGSMCCTSSISMAPAG